MGIFIINIVKNDIKGKLIGNTEQIDYPKILDSIFTAQTIQF